MRDEPIDLEHLKELVGEPAATADGNEFVHEIAPGRRPKSVEELAAAAVAAIEADRGPRRKYSKGEAPTEVVIRRKRSSYFILALVSAFALFVGQRVLYRPLPVPSDPIALVGVLSPRAAATPSLDPVWSVVRGVSDSLTERGLAVRVGALLVEFERASANGDSTAQRWADAVAALLTNQPDGIEVAAVYAAGGQAARHADARRALAPLVRAAPMEIGGWLQAARVAAAAADPGFFASVESRGSLAALLAMPHVTPEVEAARDRLDGLLHKRGMPAFAAVADALELLQRELAN